MWPDTTDRQGFEYPDNGLHISGFILEDEILMPKQRNAAREPAMPVVKNGRTTGTTFGWLNGLKSLVRYYNQNSNSSGPPIISFTSMETTIVPYGCGHGAFSDPGDSGSAILDREGRLVGLLTGGGGIAGATDLTFATAWYQLLPHIKKALPDALLL